MSIKFSKPNIFESDLKLVKKTIKSGWLTHGKNTTKFEEKFKEYTNSKYSVTVSSCTAALHLSCLALGLKKGDEVIVPAMSHTATSHAVEYTGAKTVFIDIDLETGNIDPQKIEKKITKKTKAIIIVHMAGFACQIDLIQKICKKYKIKLIEDCAHSIGTKFKSRHVGNFGVSGCFSFYPTKQITTGEGGMLVTNNKSFYNKIRKLKAFGIDKDINQRTKQGTYDVVSLGFNYRLTDFQSALGLKQIENYKKNLKKRHLLAKRYTDSLQNIQQVKCMSYSSDCSFFVFQIFCKDRDRLLKEFKIKKIGVSIHYATPLPSMTYYKKKYNLKKINFKNAKIYADTNISLPVYPSLNFKELNKIVEVINKFYEHSK
jgi:perosamine synthetase